MYRDTIMLSLSIYWWYESFERGQTSSALQDGPGAPSQSVHEVNINTATAVVQEEPALTVKQVVEILDVLYRIVQRC